MAVTDTINRVSSRMVLADEHVRMRATAALIAALGLLTYFGLVYVIAEQGWFAFDVAKTAPLFVTFVGLNLALAANAKAWVLRPWTFWVYEATHAIGLTALLHLLGGVPMGILLVTYALMVIHSQILRPDAPVFVTANLCIACYAALAWVEATGLMPPPPLLPPLDRGPYLTYVLTAFLSLNMVAVYSSRYAHQLRTLARHLQEKVTERTAALTTANADLARAYEELRAAEAQMLETEKRASLGLLASGVAHEINNPVSFIVGNTEPLRASLAKLQSFAERHQDAALDAAIRRTSRIFDTMARGAERTAAIVRDLRTFAHVGDRELAPLDLHEGIDLTLRLLRPRWVDRVAIHRDYGTIPLIEAAPGRLNQVFMNILANACDAIPAEGNVWITTRLIGTDVTVTIADDGPGIAADDLPRIFDPFFTTKPIGTGTGLGLAISRSIVDDHGGHIAVETTPGRGTAFTVTLPIAGHRARPGDGDETRSGPYDAGLRGRRPWRRSARARQRLHGLATVARGAGAHTPSPDVATP
jgi:signal transduction histidine kinase